MKPVTHLQDSSLISYHIKINKIVILFLLYVISAEVYDPGEALIFILQR